jgi:pilus assembly protein CpaE
MLVGYVEGVIDEHRLASLTALFPQVRFRTVGAVWPSTPPVGLAALVVPATDADIDNVVYRLSAREEGPPVIVLLNSSDPNSGRRLIQAGASDIVLAPVSEAAFALSLERLFTQSSTSGGSKEPGRIVGLLKAGGGVGVTAVGTQLACLLAHRYGEEGSVCFADLDLQFGLGALYMDLAETMSLTDVLDGGGSLEDAPLGTALARHRSGARLLSAPRDLTPLEVVRPDQITGLMAALRREFSLTILDLPTVWNAWTNQALTLCDHIVLMTSLSLPHSILAKRQLRVLALQRLDTITLTLACNRFTAGQGSIITQKDAEKAIGRNFDLLLPDDRSLMNDAVAQGCEISTIRGGTKLEKAISQLADVVAPATVVSGGGAKRRWRWP